MKSAGLYCIVLAAGGSERLGRPKQLAAYRGRALLLHAVEAATSVAPGRTIVVLGAHPLRMRALLRRHCAKVSIVVNPQWRSGMASSLLSGLGELPPQARAALLMLSDQPRVGARSLRRLAMAWLAAPNLPAAAHFSGVTGAPAILPRRCWAALRELSGDAGARALLRETGAKVRAVDMPEAELDVDTPQDLARMRLA